MDWTPDDIAAVIADHDFFGGLGAEERAAVVGFSRVQTVPEGEILFQTGDPYRGFYVVLEGTVQIYRLNDEGRMLVLHVIEAGESFAEVPLFQRKEGQPGAGHTYPATAEPLEDSVLLFIPEEAFLSFVTDHPHTCLSMMGELAGRLRTAVRRLDEISLQGVKTRLAGYLCRSVVQASDDDTVSGAAAQPGSTAVHLDIPKSVLAAELGTVPETLSRALGDLEDDGLIRREGDAIELVDPARLERISGR
jgi:CRP/FNR family transcriptional regulator